MPRQPDKKELRENRKAQMLLAWKADGGANASPLHAYWKKEFGKKWEYKLIDPPHHILSRDNSGKYDGVEFLITLNRLEHRMCEDGCKPLKLTGIEYMWLVLWLLNGKENNRWDRARALLGRKIAHKRMGEIIKLGETLI